MQCIRLGKSPDKKVSRSQAVMPDLMIWKQISLSHDKDVVLYNRCTGIYKLGSNTYPRCIRHRSNLGHIFRGKSASYGPGNTVFFKFTPLL